jgi:hypothetical protein
MIRKIDSSSCVLVACLALLAACKPPASDESQARSAAAEGVQMPSPPIASPNSEGAIWSAGSGPARIIYGQPGSPPFLALQCENSGPSGLIQITRFAPADKGAGAMLALVGNSHVVRIPVESVWNGEAWIWQGVISAHAPNLEAITGQREATAMVPGAGDIVLNPSHAPAQLISECRGEPPELSQ